MQRPPWYARNPHLQTVWGKFVQPEPPVVASRECWTTPDDDEVTVLRSGTSLAGAPRLLLFHGLEGNPGSHYVPALFREAAARGWGADLLLWRSCDGRSNRAARFYHSGETGDAAWFLQRIATLHPGAPLLACGVSLGGNVLTKLVGDHAVELPDTLRAAVGVSVPFDLARGSRHIGTGVSRLYERWFLRTLRAKAIEKAARYPDRFPSADRIARIRTLWEFDDLITGPLHGFTDAADYYARASAKPYVASARVPLLLLSAVDDPFLPADVLDEVRTLAGTNRHVELEFLPWGGHVGFVTGGSTGGTRSYLASRVPEFLARHLPGVASPDPTTRQDARVHVSDVARSVMPRRSSHA